MQSFVLLAVAAVWLAVIVPPLLRSRVENRPNSSVTDFRRQLSTLQRAVPTRTMVPMRGMARRLAQSPQQRVAAAAAFAHDARQPGRSAPVGRPRAALPRRDRWPRPPAHARRFAAARAIRPPVTAPMRVQRVSQRELVRRRRSNILFIMVLTVGISAFLAATTHNSFMVFTFAVSFVSLCGFCYKLVQLRNFDVDRTYGQQSWFNAA